jgi:hypothetical protein
MLKTSEIDIRALLDELEAPLVPVLDVVADEETEDGFDGLCTQHDGCRSIL